MKSLTETQSKILHAIKSIIAKNNVMPTQSELARDFGITKQAMNMHLIKIQRKGYLKLDDRGKIKPLSIK